MKTVSRPLVFTLKAWPVITLVTIGLCFLTQQIAKVFGIDLPDQKNIEVVKSIAGLNWRFLLVCLEVVVVMPAIEEAIFRLPTHWLSNRAWVVVFSILFSAAHYICQPWPDAAFLALVFFGLAQCWLYRKTGRLWCSILNHSLFNITNLVLLFILPEA